MVALYRSSLAEHVQCGVFNASIHVVILHVNLRMSKYFLMDDYDLSRSVCCDRHAVSPGIKLGSWSPY